MSFRAAITECNGGGWGRLSPVWIPSLGPSNANDAEVLFLPMFGRKILCGEAQGLLKGAWGSKALCRAGSGAQPPHFLSVTLGRNPHFFFSQYLFVNLFGCTGLGCDMRDLVRWPGIEPGSPALSLSHWTPREVPGGCKFEHFLTLHQRAQ